MKIFINEQEIKEAVCFWLAKEKGIRIGPDELEPDWHTEGTYEDSRTSMVGFSFEFKPDKGA